MGGFTRLEIPERRFFKIGEVASIVGVATSAVRFYQKEFKTHLNPVRTRTGRHVYSRRDVMVLGMIRHLVHDQQYTVRGARSRLGELLAAHNGDPSGIEDMGQGELPLESRPTGPGGDPDGGMDWDSTRRRIRQVVLEILDEVKE